MIKFCLLLPVRVLRYAAAAQCNFIKRNTIPSADSTYTINFPKAVQAMDTIYIKLLNSSVAGIRKVEIQMMENRTDKFYVDIFSTAFRRPLEIK